MQILTIKRTCTACPSQWEGTTEDGQYFYIRYRWGNLFIGKGKTLNDAIDSCIVHQKIGDSLDGFLSNVSLIEKLQEYSINFSEEAINYLIETNESKLNFNKRLEQLLNQE